MNDKAFAELLSAMTSLAKTHEDHEQHRLEKPHFHKITGDNPMLPSFFLKSINIKDRPEFLGTVEGQDNIVRVFPVDAGDTSLSKIEERWDGGKVSLIEVEMTSEFMQTLLPTARWFIVAESVDT